MRCAWKRAGRVRCGWNTSSSKNKALPESSRSRMFLPHAGACECEPPAHLALLHTAPPHHEEVVPGSRVQYELHRASALIAHCGIGRRAGAVRDSGSCSRRVARRRQAATAGASQSWWQQQGRHGGQDSKVAPAGFRSHSPARAAATADSPMARRKAPSTPGAGASSITCAGPTQAQPLF